MKVFAELILVKRPVPFILWTKVCGQELGFDPGSE